jgi:amino acid transporter
VTNFNHNAPSISALDAFHLSLGFFAAWERPPSTRSTITAAYNNVCFFGGEVKNPAGRSRARCCSRLPLSLAMYMVMTVTIIGVVPWREAITRGTLANQAIVADFIQRCTAAKRRTVMTLLILWTTFASLFAVMLGYSRVPYAAAADGRFFQPFARLHQTKNFPYVSSCLSAFASALCCSFDLPTLITALIVIQIIARDMAQAVAVILIRRQRQTFSFHSDVALSA